MDQPPDPTHVILATLGTLTWHSASPTADHPAFLDNGTLATLRLPLNDIVLEASLSVHGAASAELAPGSTITGAPAFRSAFPQLQIPDGRWGTWRNHAWIEVRASQRTSGGEIRLLPTTTHMSMSRAIDQMWALAEATLTPAAR